jgi:hypothetical protein
VPVYNVSMHLLQREQPDGPLFRFLDLSVDGVPD